MINLNKYKKIYILGSILLFLGSTIFINEDISRVFPAILIIIGDGILIAINILSNKTNGILTLICLNIFIVLYYFLIKDKNLGIINNFFIAFIIIFYYKLNHKWYKYDVQSAYD